MSFLQDLLRIKAENDAAAKLAEEQRLKAAAAEAAEEARKKSKRKRQLDALVAKWDRIITPYLREMAKAQWGRKCKVELDVDEWQPSVTWCVWERSTPEYWTHFFSVTLSCRFGEDVLVPGEFYIGARKVKEADLTIAALEEALKELFQAGPSYHSKPEKSIGAISW